MDSKQEKLDRLYWSLALHIKMAMGTEIHLDSPTIKKEKIERSNDETYKSLAENIDKIAYKHKTHEEMSIAKVIDGIETLVSQGLNPGNKRSIIKGYFKSELETAKKQRNSKSYCPACTHMYDNEQKDDSEEFNFTEPKCSVHPETVYPAECKDFEDFGCMNWETHYRQLDEDIKLSELVIAELEERPALKEEKDYRMKSAVEKFIDKLK